VCVRPSTQREANRRLGRSREWRDSISLLEGIRHLGFEVDPLAWGALLGCCARAVGQNKGRRANADPQGGAPSSATIWTRAVRLWAELLQDGTEPDVIMLGTAVAACGRSWAWHSAAQLLSGARSRGGPEPNLIVRSAVLSACAGAALWTAALQLLSESKRGLDAIAVNAALDACARGGQPLRALALLKAMPAEGLEPDMFSLNTAISVCAKGTLWREALSLLGDADRLGFGGADAVGLSAAIIACGRGERSAGLWRRALALLLGGRHLEPDGLNAACNAACASCEVAGQWERAFELTESVLRQHGLRPDLVTVNSLIAACETSRQWSWALHLLREELCGRRGLRADLVGYNAAAGACALAFRLSGKRSLQPATDHAAGWQWAVWIQASMRSEGLFPDLVTSNTLLSAYGRAAAWPQAVEVLRGLPRARLSPDTISCSAALAACAAGSEETRARPWRAMLQLLHAMPASRLEPQETALGSVAAACGSWAWSLHLVSGPTPSVAPGIAALGAAIEACERQGSGHSDLLGRLCADLRQLLLQHRAVALSERDQGLALLATELLAGRGQLCESAARAALRSLAAPARRVLHRLAGSCLPGPTSTGRLCEPVLDLQGSLGAFLTTSVVDDMREAAGLHSAYPWLPVPTARLTSRRWLCASLSKERLGAYEEPAAKLIAVWCSVALLHRSVQEKEEDERS
ncbi:unnamed protein product, partial [Polarella glacialis]